MRTSHLQYAVMVEFMEKNGDLSKPTGGPRGRDFIQKKWKELAAKLNSDGTGDSRSEEKWRKVWSDLKNNTKKKWAKINRAASGTGGGPALQLSLTDLENRIMQIIGVQAATGMAVAEAGFGQDNEEVVPSNPPSAVAAEAATADKGLSECAEYIVDWNTPGTSSQFIFSEPGPPPTVPPPSVLIDDPPPSPPVASEVEKQYKAPQKKKQKKDDVAHLFVECDRSTREYARERDRILNELERERLRQRDEELRLREIELTERVRQRDIELQLQMQWIEFMKEAMEVIKRYFERHGDGSNKYNM